MKTCPKCFFQLEDEARFCSRCGFDFSSSFPRATTTVNANSSSADNNLRCDNSQYYAANTIVKTATKSSFILAIIAVCLCWVPIVGVLLGIAALIWTIVDGVHSPYSKSGRYIASIIMAVLTIFVGYMLSSSYERSNRTNTYRSSVSVNVKDESTSGSTKVTIAESYNSMKVGDIGKTSDCHIGLSYAKVMSTIPVSIGDSEYPPSDQKYLALFFDVLCDASKKTIYSDNFTVYVDGVKAGSPNSTFVRECDGYQDQYWYTLYKDTQAMVFVECLIPKDFEEIKVFYDNCSWVLRPQDLKTETFARKSMYDIDISHNMEPNKPGDIIIDNGDYQMVYDGYEFYYKDSWVLNSGGNKYAVIKVHYINLGTESADIIAHAEAFEGNYYTSGGITGGPNFGKYENQSGVSEIHGGMTAYVYYIFEVMSEDEPIYLVLNADKNYTLFIER